MDAEQDIRAILSLTRIDPSDYGDRNWDAIDRGLRIWYANARFADLLHGLYVVERLPGRGSAVLFEGAEEPGGCKTPPGPAGHPPWPPFP